MKSLSSLTIASGYRLIGEFDGHFDGTLCVAISPSGDTLATGGKFEFSYLHGMNYWRNSRGGWYHDLGCQQEEERIKLASGWHCNMCSVDGSIG
jgi:hypothetical protein